MEVDKEVIFIEDGIINNLKKFHNIDAISEIKKILEQDKEFVNTLKEKNDSQST
jgi:hypothetical protein